MKISVVKLSDGGSCNYCKKGKLSASGYNLLFPYTDLIKVEGTSISTYFCRDCFKETQDKVIQ